MTFPRIDQTPAGPMLITGRRCRDDGSEGCCIGSMVRRGDEQRALDAAREFDAPAEPRFVRLMREADAEMPMVRGLT